MTKMTGKRWGVAAVATLVVVLGLAVFLPSLDAAIAGAIPPKGTYNPCSGFKTHPIAIPNGPIFTSVTSGGIGVVVGDHFQTTDGRHGANLGISALRSTGQVEGLGQVDIGIDATRATRSTIVANQVGSDYPATQRMRFYPIVSIDGREYRAIDVANLENTSVASTPPPVGTVYVLTNDVRMEDPAKPGSVAFVIKPSKAFEVTGHQF